MVRKLLLVLLMGLCIDGCVMRPEAGNRVGTRVTLPAFTGWYAGERVYYITTDISDPVMGQTIGANYAPRLRDAVPTQPKRPEERTVLERVYKFAPAEQDAVFASAPRPPGPQSQDTAYSPLWLIYNVTWNDPKHPHRVLTGEEAILSAEEAHEVSIVRTQIVINCPIVATYPGARLPNAVLVW